MTQPEQVLGPYQDRVIGYLLSAGGVILAVAIGAWVFRYARRELSETLERREYSPRTVRTSTLAFQWFGWVVIALVAMRLAGVNVSVTSGPLSLVIWLLILATVAGWNGVTSFVCGLLLVNRQPFQIGDDVEILEPTGAQGPIGRVTTFTYLYTTLQQIDPNHGRTVEVQVPNVQFFTRSFRREPGAQSSPLRAGK